MAKFINKSFIWISLIWGYVFFQMMIASCSSNTEHRNSRNNNSNNSDQGKSSITHAVGFDIIDYDEFQILKLFSHYNESTDTLHYLLKAKDVVAPYQFQDYPQIITPVSNIALLHSSYISFFNFCETTDHIVAISEVKYLYDENLYNAVSKGELPEVGYGETLDREKLLSTSTELVITVGFPNAPNKSEQVLRELGIPVLVFSDWQETSLMGRMEWVKVVAALTAKEEQVDSRYREIESEYNELLSLSQKVETKPTVICNLPYRDSWFVPGGNSYISNLLADAGAQYLWSEDSGTGAIQLDFESVYAKAIDADYWINPDFANSLTDISDKDERLKDFNSVYNGKIFNKNKRTVRGAANDYWESAIISPHIVLADIIKILHPELLPDHQLYYYNKLN